MSLTYDAVKNDTRYSCLYNNSDTLKERAFSLHEHYYAQKDFLLKKYPVIAYHLIEDKIHPLHKDTTSERTLHGAPIDPEVFKQMHPNAEVTEMENFNGDLNMSPEEEEEELWLIVSDYLESYADFVVDPDVLRRAYSVFKK